MSDRRIIVLDDQVINQIAAGEVVERPASVVKELIENALDADSTDISVEIAEGGKKLVRVADNGVGMDRDNALLALERHATSKIRKVEDLGSIASLGFRGEALPSIGAVSQLVLTSRPQREMTGTQIHLEGGVLREVADSPRSPGTTVEVKNLFYNLPARRKFLKTAETELRHLSRTVIEYALAYRDTAFRLVHDGREIYRFHPVRDLKERVQAVFGKALAAQVVPLSHQQERLTITGWAGKPAVARQAQTHKLFYVNQRVITSRTINHAVMEGYHTLLQKGWQPFILLFITIDPEAVDVNVHPTKREVRFYQEGQVHQAVVQAVRAGLLKESLVPEAAVPPATGSVPGAASYHQRVRSSIDTYLSRRTPEAAPAAAQGDIFAALPQTPPLTVREKGRDDTRESLEHLWQLHNTFIFAQTKGGVLIIDQHAAHERVLYEEALASLAGERRAAQQLLFPATLTLSHPEFVLVQELLPLLQQMGFSLRTFTGTTVVADAIPPSVKNWNEGKLLLEMVDEMGQHGRLTSGLKERLVVTYACKAAIKAGDPLKPEEMEFLISRLFATSNPYTCPHGRPAIIKMPLNELAAKFGR